MESSPTSAVSPSPVVAPGERGWTWRDTRRVVVAGSTLAVGGLIARSGVPEIERDLFELVNGLPGGLYPVVWLPMQTGSRVGGLLLAAALGAGTRRLVVGVLSVGAVTATWAAAKVIKDVVGRARPLEVGLEVEVHDTATGLGYVSGHAALAFAMYSMAAPHLRYRWRVAALGLASFVAAARVYSGSHLPLDVVGGAALGVLIGEGFRRIESADKARRLRRAAIRSGRTPA